ncbi:MAG: hypothetical protein ACK55Z_23540, partial [bacterium]
KDSCRIKKVYHKRKIQQCLQLHLAFRKSSKLPLLLALTSKLRIERDLPPYLRRDSYKLLQKATKIKLIYQI